ncbi:MAG: hypothetical protein RL386_380, partial [Bacteroidota bacterium]
MDCVNSLLLPLAAEYCFERHVIFVTIYYMFPRLRREGFFGVRGIF